MHEFADDYRSWEQQVRYILRRYRCVTYNARGYPPSDVPDEQALYSQGFAADDIAAVMAENYAGGAYRIQFRDKDPRGWQEFTETLAQHSAKGLAQTVAVVRNAG